MTRSNQRWSPIWEIDAPAALICIAVTGAAYMLMIQPALQHRHLRTTQQQTLEQKHIDVTNLTGQLSRLKLQLEKIRVQLAVNDQEGRRLQPASAINTRLASLTDLSRQCHLELIQIQPSDLVEGTHYHTLPIFLAGVGSYEACVRFIERMTEQFRDTAIESIDLQGDPGRPVLDGQSQVRFTFELAWHTAPHKVRPSPPTTGAQQVGVTP